MGAEEVRDFEGEVGNPRHITRIVKGTLPIEKVAYMHGVMGERPGEHRNKQGQRWVDFMHDVQYHGIKSPLFITHDYGGIPKLSEGNHRRDAAVAIGKREVPVEVRYFGHAERDDRLFNDRRT